MPFLSLNPALSPASEAHGEHALVAVLSGILPFSVGFDTSRPSSQRPTVNLASRLVAKMQKSRLPGPPQWATLFSSGPTQ